MAKQNKKTTKILGGFDSWVFFNIPLLIFLTFLGLIYIFNSHSVERKLNKIEHLKKERSEARWRYLEAKRKVMVGSTASQLEKNVRQKELKRLKKAHGYIEKVE